MVFRRECCMQQNVKDRESEMNFYQKHVVLVNTWPVVNGRGGAERVFCDMANALSEMGYKVTLLCCDSRNGAMGYPLSNKVRFINACKGVPLWYKKPFRNLLCLGLKRESRHLKRRIIDYQWMIPALRKALRDICNVDVFIAFQASTTYMLKKIGVDGPIVTMFHSVPSIYIESEEWSLLQKSVNESSALTVLMPNFVEMAKNALSKVPIICIPNAVQQFKRPSQLDGKSIVCLARLNSEKRIDLLLMAFNLIKEKFPDWSVDIYGELNKDLCYKEKVIKLHQALSLEGRVNFHGIAPDVELVLNEASIFAFPSMFEGFGLALVEAMSKGLAVVACKDCSAVNVIVEDGVNGLLVEPNPEALATALEQLILDKNLRKRLGSHARLTALNYAPEKIWPKWNNLIMKVVNKEQGDLGC